MTKRLGRLTLLGAMLVLTSWVSAEAIPGYCPNVCYYGPGQLSTPCTCPGTGQVTICGSYFLGVCY
ncbi:MAG TPA: hypothetical protein VL025_11650 [Thermoanaerobaculia bacterium]|nr:hypothetical protein [Thermoanaerobaculia bacterium]